MTSARETLKHLARWMKPKSVGVGLELLPGRARILYQPVGVVGIISPWNYPIQLALMPLIAALAAGNRVMLKPSELTPRTSEFLADFLGRLFPEEKVATILGGPEVGAAFAALPFDHLFYTGSTEIGRRVMRAAAENLTPVTLELGGKSPCIIGRDAALPAAAESIASGKLLNAGQTCIAPDYILVPEDIRDRFVGLIHEAVTRLYPSLAANPDYTSIINARHYGRITRYIEEARQRGTRVVEINPAGEALSPQERKIAPTLLLDPADDLAVMREEIFGPVLPVKSYRTLDDAIDYVNARPRPLALYYFGRDTARARQGSGADDLRRGFNQRDADAYRGRKFAVWRHRPFRHGRLSRRIWVPDFLASQRRLPAKPLQRSKFSAPALSQDCRRHEEDSSQQVSGKSKYKDSGIMTTVAM